MISVMWTSEVEKDNMNQWIHDLQVNTAGSQVNFQDIGWWIWGLMKHYSNGEQVPKTCIVPGAFGRSHPILRQAAGKCSRWDSRLEAFAGLSDASGMLEGSFSMMWCHGSTCWGKIVQDFCLIDVNLQRMEFCLVWGMNFYHSAEILRNPSCSVH